MHLSPSVSLKIQRFRMHLQSETFLCFVIQLKLIHVTRKMLLSIIFEQFQKLPE